VRLFVSLTLLLPFDSEGVSQSVRNFSKAEVCNAIATKKESFNVTQALYRRRSSSDEGGESDPAAAVASLAVEDPSAMLDPGGKPCDFFRLINVLVSDGIKLTYAQLGQHTERAARDGDMSPAQAFSQMVFEAYHDEDDYGDMQFQHEMLSVSNPPIDPSNFATKTEAQLTAMRLVLQREHSRLMQNCNTSGNHEDFPNYVHGNLKQLYYWLALCENPDIENAVHVSLGAGVFREPSTGADRSKKRMAGASKNGKGSKRGKKDNSVSSSGGLSFAFVITEVLTYFWSRWHHRRWPTQSKKWRLQARRRHKL